MIWLFKVGTAPAHGARLQPVWAVPAVPVWVCKPAWAVPVWVCKPAWADTPVWVWVLGREPKFYF